MPRGGRWIQRVIFRVWQSVQQSGSQEEHELGTITLRFLSLIRRGEAATLDLACSEAFGCHFNVWRQRSMGRMAALAWELSALIPDYDAEVSHVHKEKAPRPSPLEWPVPRLSPSAAAQPKPLRAAPADKCPPPKRLPKAAG